MLSYRHAFHAGNHADILKHFVLWLVLDYFGRKDKPYWYIDTHSGAGLYDLGGSEAQKVGEYRHGAARLFAAAEQGALPEELALRGPGKVDRRAAGRLARERLR